METRGVIGMTAMIKDSVKVVAAMVVLIATKAVVKLWLYSGTNGWASAAVVVGAGLVVVLVAWIVQVRRRNRQRTRMLEMRGSALW